MPSITLEAKNGQIIHQDTDRISFEQCNYQPGDLTQFAPYGNGWYGHQESIPNLFKLGPTQEANGGVIFFDADTSETFLSNFKAMLNLLDIKTDKKDISVFILESKDPKKDGYLKQMRIVSKFASRHHFHAISEREYDSFKIQEISIFDFLMYFIGCEIEQWGNDCFTNKGLWGKFGGDGNYAKEKLCFGFTIENDYYGIYRIWSRAWLVTK